MPANAWRPGPSALTSESTKVYAPEYSAHFDVSGGVAVPRGHESSYVNGNPAGLGVLVLDDDIGLMVDVWQDVRHEFCRAGKWVITPTP